MDANAALESKSQSDEPRYRVGMVARLTGLSAHTIRMWERRYDAVTPRRTPAGGRLYTDRDVARLALLKDLVDLGHSIGGIAQLPDEALERSIALHASGSDQPSRRIIGQRDRFLNYIENLDVASAEQLTARAAATLEPKVFINELVGPILRELGDRWEAGELRVVHEHIASSILRSLIIAITRTYGGSQPGRQRVLVATPQGERHEFGALMASLVAAVHRARVVYLGTDLPADEIRYAAEQLQSQLVLMSIVQLPSNETRQCVQELEKTLPFRSQLLVGGAGGARLTLERAKYLGDFVELEDLVTGS